jgi:hypothetical protein
MDIKSPSKCTCLDIRNCDTCTKWANEVLVDCILYTEGPVTYYLKGTDETYAIYKSINETSESKTICYQRLKVFITENCQYIDREGQPLEIVDRTAK